MKIKSKFRLLLSIFLMAGLNMQVVHADSPAAQMSQGVLLLVDTTLDSNAPDYQGCQDINLADCSLRGAISRANAEPAVIFTILLPPGIYHLSLPGEEDDNQAGDLDVRGRVGIFKQSSGEVVITADGLERVFQFFPAAYGVLNDLTITGGRAGPDQSGGGIYNAGSLFLKNVMVTGNRAGDGSMAGMEDTQGGPGGSGGGIENFGELTIQNSMISENQAGTGGDTLPTYPGYTSQTGGVGGLGGGIANWGNLKIFDSIIKENQAGAGGLGRSNYVPPYDPGSAEINQPDSYNVAGNGGDGGSGGGIFNGNRLSILNSEVSGNRAGAGGAGGTAYILGGVGGQGGNGGGISTYNWLHAENTIIAKNVSGLSGPSGYGDYKQGQAGTRGPGHGGGLHNAAQAELVACQVKANLTAPEIQEYYFYRVADGGGIYNDQSANLSLRDTQVMNNQASGAGGGILNLAELTIIGGKIDGNQARRLGGGIRNDGWLQGSTFSLSGNVSGPGYDGYQAFAGFAGLTQPLDGETPGGGGLFNAGQAWLAAVDIDQNIAGDGGDGGDSSTGYYIDYPGADGGSGGYGGGIYNQGALDIFLSTLARNQTGQGGMGGTGVVGDGLNGTGGPGGAVFNTGVMNAANITILENTTGPGASLAESGGPGGGLVNSGQLSLSNSQVTGNQTALNGIGGGIAVLGCQTNAQEALIANTSILGNRASADGGGLYLRNCDTKLDNLIIAGNQIEADNHGSGLFQENGNTIPRHLTVASNTGGDGTGIYLHAGTAVFTNTVIAGQPLGVYLAQDGQAELHTTLWGAGTWANVLDWSGPGLIDIGSQNIYADPLFLDPVNSDYHIQAVSPAVNSGQPIDLTTDLDNQPRPAPGNDLPDIGADETWSLIPLTGLSLVAPEVITATIPAEFSVELLPPDATPNVTYLWSPLPQTGQGTPQAQFIFQRSGEQVVTVWVIQAGKALSITTTVLVQAATRYLYLPFIKR